MKRNTNNHQWRRAEYIVNVPVGNLVSGQSSLNKLNAQSTQTQPQISLTLSPSGIEVRVD